MQRLAGTAHSQISVPDPAQGYQTVGEFLDLKGIAADNDDLQAVMMIHMDMGG